MGSRLTVESETGRGSCFAFDVALDFTDPRRSLGDTRIALDQLTNLPVLIVDDNRTNRETPSQMLADQTMKPHAVAWCREALAELARADQVATRYRLAIVHKSVSQSDLLDAAMTALNIGGDQSDLPTRRFTSSTPHKELNVLVAEDTTANQQVVSPVLGRRGHTVVIARKGREAVGFFRERRFDVVLMDLQIPIMDGYQATAAMHGLQQGQERRTPIIAMKAHIVQGDHEKCLNAGMQAYISKPNDLHGMIEKVEGVAGVPPGLETTPQQISLPNDT